MTGWGQMPYPWWISWCGDLDITGVKKPQSFYRDIVWGRSPVELAVHEPIATGKTEMVGLWGWPAEFQSWNWKGQEGRELSVSVYSRSERVRLELNGRLIGEKPVEASKGITAAFMVPYEPGVLLASALVGGKVVGTRELSTTGPASGLRASPEKTSILASRESLVYVPIEVIDGKGSQVPDAALPLRVSVEGPAQVAAFGTGDPTDTSPPQGASATSFRGRALVILRSTGKPGRITLRVVAPGLAPCSSEVQALGPQPGVAAP